ncbi:unnamed protein product [Mucor hiemalis]
MKHRGRHSSPPTVRDRRGIPIVQPSPSRSNVKLVDSSMEEDQDEIQLCKVPVKQNTPIATTYHQQQQQRSQFEQFNRTISHHLLLPLQDSILGRMLQPSQ